MAIAKTCRFNSLFEVVVVYIKALNKPQNQVITLIYILIKSSNLFKNQKALKKDSMFKIFAVKCV